MERIGNVKPVDWPNSVVSKPKIEVAPRILPEIATAAPTVAEVQGMIAWQREKIASGKKSKRPISL